MRYPIKNSPRSRSAKGRKLGEILFMDGCDERKRVQVGVGKACYLPPPQTNLVRI